MTKEKKPKRILIAEDERPMAKVLELKLTRLGFEVRVAYNGEEAIKFLTKEKFDLVLTDLVMPRIDGFGVLKFLQDKKDKIPVIVSSNLGQEEDLERAKILGADDYFIKSDTPIVKVVENINKLLDK